MDIDKLRNRRKKYKRACSFSDMYCHSYSLIPLYKGEEVVLS